MLQTTKVDAWPALKDPIFRMLWVATLASNIGTWMHEVGAAWLMLSMTKNALWVSLIQAATSLSIFLLALPAGALADIFDRRRYLIGLQSSMLLVAATLASVTYWGLMTPPLLLMLTFFLGCGAALSTPTWQSIIPEIVKPEDLYSGIILNGLAFNISRAIGPAIAGFIIAALGVGAVFAINAISFCAIIFALKRWKRIPNESTLPAERFFGAIRAGLRYVRATPSLQQVMIKSGAFFIFASAVWALVPVTARLVLKCGPISYGILLACLGVGAILGAFCLQKLRKILTIDQLVFLGAMAFSLTCYLLGVIQHYYVACAALILAGFAWISVIATLNTQAQLSVSSWVRARALSVYLMIFLGSMALGSVIWGWLATQQSVKFSLLVAGFGIIISNVFTYWVKLENTQMLDHTPAKDSPAPTGEALPEHEQGPVMINVEYRVKRENQEKFMAAIAETRRIRLREGAFFWSLFHDIENHQRFVECFMVESWLEHLRYHERVSISDRKTQSKVNAFHEGSARPKVTHLFAEQVPPKKSK